MKRILVVQLNLQPPGGGNGVCAWLVEGLHQLYELTLLTWVPVDMAPVNRYYGTSIDPTTMRFLLPGPSVRMMVNATPLPLADLKIAILGRIAKGIGNEFDLAITVANEADLGGACIQYVHYPRYLRPRPDVEMRWYHGAEALNRLYYRFTDAVARVDRRRIRDGITLANSNWTAALVNKSLGIQARVCYPPASGDYDPLPWSERENGFLCIGRISPEKELEKVVSILGAVRSQGSDIHLHLVGSRDDGPYYRRIKRVAEDQHHWISLHEDLSKEELVRLICRHRYGIHGMQEEHFGMAVAEMVSGGCVPFVPAGGGQREIIEDARLLYSSTEDAVTKISALLSDPAQQLTFHHQCVEAGRQFSSDRFVGTVREIVEESLER